MQSVTMNFKLPFKLIKRKKWYVATCPILDVASQGETPAKARKNLIEALSAFFITCLENGTLDAVMQECGFKPSLGQKVKSAQKSEYINIPISLLASEPSRNRCHA